MTNFAGDTAITSMPRKGKLPDSRRRLPPTVISRSIAPNLFYRAILEYDGGESDGRGNVNFGFLEIRIGESLVCTWEASGNSMDRYTLHMYAYSLRGQGWVSSECLRKLSQVGEEMSSLIVTKQKDVW